MADNKDNNNSSETNKKDAVILKPNTLLKDMIGNVLSLDRILHEGVVEEAEYIMEANIELERDNYFRSSMEDVSKLKLICSRIKKNQGTIEDNLLQIQDISLLIKSNAGLFDYDLAAKFATSLYFLSRRLKDIDDKAIVVLESYVKAMEVIFTKHITYQDNELAKELLEEYDKIQKWADDL